MWKRFVAWLRATFIKTVYVEHVVYVAKEVEYEDPIPPRQLSCNHWDTIYLESPFNGFTVCHHCYNDIGMIERFYGR